MDGTEQDPAGGSSPWVAPPRHTPEDSDWLLSWSRSTRQAPPDPPRPDRNMWRPRPPKFGPLLAAVEARRLAPILDGSEVRMVDTPDGPRRAIVHRHWFGLVLRLVGGVVTVIVAIAVSPVYFALALLAGVHALVIAGRTGVKQSTAGVIAGSELAFGVLLDLTIGEGFLRAVLILASLFMLTLTVVAWQVDMELITEGGRLVRTRGLWLMKRTVAAPLTSIRIANTKGPFLGLGFVTVDTTSDNDQLLHNFGLIGQPNEWAALLLREATRPRVTASKATG